MMKYILLFGFLTLILSCGVPTNNANTENTKEVEEKVQTVSISQIIDPLGDPCKVSGDEITKILGWKKGSDGRPNAINNDFRKGCDYGRIEGNLQVAFERFKERTIERKYLEQTFKLTLENPSNNMTTQEIPDGFGDQTIFMFGKEGPNHTYKIMWRFGNHTQKSVRFFSSKKQDAEEKLKQLKLIAAKLEN